VWGDNISPTNTGVAYQTEQIVRCILVIVAAWFVTRLISLIFLDSINEKRKKPLPNIVKDIIGAVVYSIALVIIITQVYNESITSIGAFLISSWALIGFASKDLISDCINGIALDLQASFETGDWIQLQDKSIAQITKMKMTKADLILPDDTVLSIGNTVLNNAPIINLSKPGRDYFLGISVVLEHTVPVDRARRILQAAAVSSPGTFNNDASVFAESVQWNGVVYVIYFRIPTREVWLEARHQVITSVTKYLHKFGMKICQITGEINVRAIDASITVFDDCQITDPLTTLQMSGLLEDCDLILQQKFAQKMRIRKYGKGEIIFSEGDAGDTMFIISEGIVDVKINISSNDNRVACLVDGEYFGETALLQGESRNATVAAQTDVVVYEIQRTIVKQFVEQYSDFAQRLSLAIVKRQLSNSNTRENALDRKEKEEKTAVEFMNAFKKFLWNH
jgi:small-conductance mechanosensitive channel